jgi:hypothetical protein
MGRGARLTPHCRSRLAPYINHLLVPSRLDRMEESTRLAGKVRDTVASTLAVKWLRVSPRTLGEIDSPACKGGGIYSLIRPPSFYTGIAIRCLARTRSGARTRNFCNLHILLTSHNT